MFVKSIHNRQDQKISVAMIKKFSEVIFAALCIRYVHHQNIDEQTVTIAQSS